MSETSEKPEALVETLTPEQQQALVAALDKIEVALMKRAGKRMKQWLLLAAGVVTLFGVITFVGLKATIVEEASKKLAGDSDLRRELVDRSIEKLESATSVLERAKTLAADLETESAHGSAAIVAELREIHEMIDQVRDDLRGALAPAPIDPGINE